MRRHAKAKWVLKTVQGKQAKLDVESREQQRILRAFSRLSLLPSSGAYDITVGHKRKNKFMWFRVAKVCTRSIYEHLISSGVTLDCEHAYRVLYPPHLYEDHFKFAFVRNPWDRLVSAWQDKVVTYNYFGLDPAERTRLLEFGNFVEYVAGLDLEGCDIHLRQQCSMIDLNHVDFVGRFETFAVDYQLVCKRLGISIGELRHMNQSNREDYRAYYRDEWIERVYECYEKDIRVFGYQFGEGATFQCC